MVDGTPAVDANLDATSVAIAPNGDLVLTDTQVDEVLVAAARSGLFCGPKLTAGDIYVLAGDGRGRPTTPAARRRPAAAPPVAIHISCHVRNT